MAKDDMQVLFCKILIYLYKVLKGNQKKGHILYSAKNLRFSYKQRILTNDTNRIVRKGIYPKFDISKGL